MISNYYLKTETYNQTEIDDKLDLKLNASLISNYYLTTETYNQKEIDDKLDLKLNASIINDYYNKFYIDDLIAKYYLKKWNIQPKRNKW